MKNSFRLMLLGVVLALFSIMPLAAQAQDEGVLYRVSLDSGNTDFSRYDIATDTWTTLAPFSTGSQMATSADGRLFGWNSIAGEIQEYSPMSDSWSFIQSIPPVTQSYGNLEYRANGEWVYTASNTPTLYYTVGGEWQTLALPFSPNAIGDYDPVTDTLVIGQYTTSFFHAVDMGSLTITSFTMDGSGNGERSRCGQIRNGRFYYETQSNPLRYLDLANNMAAPVDVAPSFGFFPTCAVSETAEELYILSLEGLTLSRLDLPDSGSTPLAGHTSVGNHSSLTWVGASVALDYAAFTVTKTFSDGLITDVEVAISCNDGFVNADSATISSDGGSFRFVITDFISGSMDCDITEAGTEGYLSDSCTFTDVTGGEYTCDLVNDAEPGSFSVTKTWDILGQDVDVVDQDVTLVIDCESDISNPMPLPCSSQPDSTQCVWDLDWDGLGLGDSVTASVDVDTSAGDAFCTAYELGIDASEVESSDDCDPRMLVEAAGSNGCEITNTVFFEGIPTLSQYGLALMALLMLGMGMIGFRRFA